MGGWVLDFGDVPPGFYVLAVNAVDTSSAADAVNIEVQAGALTDVAERVSQMEEVRYVGLTTGTYDMMISAAFHDTDELFHFITERLNKTPGIWRTHTSHVLKVWKRNFDWSVTNPPLS